ncbi:CaiB/BaiF CoA transferase family protein [[Anoxybacillus] calidus]|uniref:CaiB/BaiF CoA transferase family protein n=1 Tax=[Anoxybacillus] calidus TaxID=575178 RepID=UPI0015EB737C|nr:CaiB/BaiF CoA-transferase family protein [Anoxybacillus calidus]
MLDGMKVLDFSHYIPGPFASLRLADFGAEVVKVEPPNGDLARSEEFNNIFQANNANKKSISLNLKDQHDLEIVKQLIRKADILIEGFRPGVMKRLGLAYDDVKKINEKIIYCSITGYGQQGELALLGSHDINYMSLSGVLSQLKDKSGKPIHPSITLADMVGSFVATEQILAALYARERTGKGMYIDVSLLDGLLSMMNNHFMIEHDSGLQRGMEQLAGTIVSYYIYETKDGRFVSLAALERKFWEHFCIASQKQEWLDFHQSPANESNPVFVEICQWFKSKTLSEWIEFSRKVDCCLTPVLEVHEAKEWFSKEHSRKMVDIHDDRIHIATRYDCQIFHKRAQAPKLDEHREEIIKRWRNS